MEIDETLVKIVVGIALIIAILFDWPRAIAGVVVGIAGRLLKQPWWMILVGVVLVAGLGEVIYATIGRTSGMSWPSFWYGFMVAGATASGLHRVLAYMMESS